MLILLLLQAAFASWRLALLLIVTLPMALVGGVIAAWGALGTITLGAFVGFFSRHDHQGGPQSPGISARDDGRAPASLEEV